MKIYKLCKKYLEKMKGLLILYISLTLISSIIAYISPYVSGLLIDTLASNFMMSSIYYLLWIIALVFLVQTILGYVEQRLYVHVQVTLGVEFNKDILYYIQDMPINYIQNSDLVYLNQKVNNDTNSLIIFCISFMQQFIQNTLTLIILSIFLLTNNITIGLLILGLGMLYVISYLLIRKPVYKRSLEFNESQSKFFSKLFEQLKYAKFLKTHGIIENFRKKLDEAFSKLFSSAIKYMKISYLFNSMDGVIYTLARIILFLFGASEILKGDFSIGMFVIFNSYFSMIMDSIRYYFSVGKTYQDALVSYNRIIAILNEKPDSSGRDHLVARPQNITIKNFSLCFNETVILENLNLNFTVGNVYSLVVSVK